MLDLSVDPDFAGTRLDKFLTRHLPTLSRSAIQRAIKSGGARVNEKPAKPGTALREGDRVRFDPPPTPASEVEPEEIPLEILYEDEQLVAINKPAGLVVHPAPGHPSGTLVNALLHHFARLSHVNAPDRPGIVHRLDAGTSGVILVAKTDAAHVYLARQFEEHTVAKTYLALVEGDARFDANVIDLPLGRHFKHRQKQAVRVGDGRAARTAYRVLERFGRYHLVEAKPETGRTHQIRVHLAAEGIRVLCDATYGRRAAITASELLGRERQPDEKPVLDRQALHAKEITIVHPGTKMEVSFRAEVPYDMQCVLALLRERGTNAGRAKGEA